MQQSVNILPSPCNDGTTVKKQRPYNLPEPTAQSPSFHEFSSSQGSELLATTRQNNPQNTPRGQRLKRTYPLSSLFTKSVKFLTQKQVDDQARRFEECQRRRKEELQAKAAELDTEQKQKLKTMPDLTVKTKQLCKTISNDPLYLRYERELQHKQKRLDQKIAQIAKQRKQAEQKELEEMELYRNRAAEKGSRDYDGFFEEMVRWKKNRNDKLDVKRTSEHEKEVEGLTFQPQINNKSKRLVLKKKRSQPLYLQQRNVHVACRRR